MNNEILIQNLTEAFEILKDSWDYKKDAIINCIVETEHYDGALSMDMWLYILRSHMPIKTQEYANGIIDDVLKRFLNKNVGLDTTDGRNESKAFLNHVVPHLIKNEELIIDIFRHSYNAGYKYTEGWDDILTSNIVVCVACILILGNSRVVELLIKSLSQNELMYDITMGGILLKANKYIEYISRNEDEFGKKYTISEDVKETLLRSLIFIEDKSERAECTIAFLSY